MPRRRFSTRNAADSAEERAWKLMRFAINRAWDDGESALLTDKRYKAGANDSWMKVKQAADALMAALDEKAKGKVQA